MLWYTILLNDFGEMVFTSSFGGLKINHGTKLSDRNFNHVVTILDTVDREIPNLSPRSSFSKPSHNFISVNKNSSFPHNFRDGLGFANE